MPQGNESREASKAVTFRVPQEVLRELSGLALMDNTTLASEIREAAHTYIANRRSADTFPDELAAAHKRIAQELAIDPTEQQ